MLLVLTKEGPQSEMFFIEPKNPSYVGYDWFTLLVKSGDQIVDS